MLAEDIAIAFALSSYISQESPMVVTTTVERNAKPTKPAKVATSKGEVKAPVNAATTAPTMTALQLPDSGTLDAKGFLKACNKAKVTRDELIVAIAAYIGFDRNESFGFNDSKARTQAKRELNPLTISAAKEPHKRNGAPSTSVAGYVKGMPDYTYRKLQDLLGRETLAVEAMISHNQSAAKATSTHERDLHMGLARLEQVRLDAIRKDIASF
jgi:hypothetical protein